MLLVPLFVKGHLFRAYFKFGKDLRRRSGEGLIAERHRLKARPHMNNIEIKGHYVSGAVGVWSCRWGGATATPVGPAPIPADGDGGSIGPQCA